MDPFLLFTLVLAAAPVAQPSTSFLYILGALFAGGVVTTLYQAYLRWRRGPLEDQELVSRITATTNSDMKGILNEYRMEVEVVKRQVEDYRKQLHDLTKELANATLRISQLEIRLENSEEDKGRLQRDLAEAQRERVRLEMELERLRQEIKAKVETLKQ